MTSPKKAEWEEELQDLLESAGSGKVVDLKSFISQTHTDLLTELSERVEKMPEYIYVASGKEEVVPKYKFNVCFTKNDILTLIDSLLVTDEKDV